MTSNTTRLILSVLLGTWLLLPVPAPAAEQAQSAPDREQPDADRSENDTDDAGAESENARDNAEVFIPSEEISEDFAVSFPVDI